MPYKLPMNETRSIHYGQTITLECGNEQQVTHMHTNDLVYCESCKMYEEVKYVTIYDSRDVTRDRVGLPYNSGETGKSWHSVGDSGVIATFRSPNGQYYAIGMDRDGIPRTYQRVGNGDYVQVTSS